MHALPAMLDLAGADLLHRQLRLACTLENAVVLDGSLVERVSTACVQVLVAAAVATRARGLCFTLMRASPALMTALDELGLTMLLGAEDPA